CDPRKPAPPVISSFFKGTSLTPTALLKAVEREVHFAAMNRPDGAQPRSESPRSAKWASRDLFRPAAPPGVFWRYSKQHSKQHSNQPSKAPGPAAHEAPISQRPAGKAGMATRRPNCDAVRVPLRVSPRFGCF